VIERKEEKKKETVTNFLFFEILSFSFSFKAQSQ